MNTMEDARLGPVALGRTAHRVPVRPSAFGILAAVLAFVGLYGVTAYSVTRRSSELGLRMALGATSGRVTTMVLKEVLWLTGVGVAAALPCVWFAGRLVESQFYGVAARDPLTILLASATLVAVTVLAGALPSDQGISPQSSFGPALRVASPASAEHRLRRLFLGSGHVVRDVISLSPLGSSTELILSRRRALNGSRMTNARASTSWASHSGGF